MARKRNRIRLALNMRNPLALSLDVFTGQNPRMPRARCLQVEVAIFDGDARESALLDDITDVVSMTLEVKALVTDAGALMAQTLAAAALNSGLQLQNWNGGIDSDSHALFTFPESGAGGTGLDLTGGTGGTPPTQKDFVAVVTALTSVGNLTLGTFTLTCINDGGLTSANTPAAGDPQYVRVDQLNAALANYLKVNGDPGVPHIINSKNGLWRRRLGMSDTGVRIDDVAKVG